MTNSFTQYAQNFLNHIPQQNGNIYNTNFYINNANVEINNKETISMKNKIVVISKFSDKKDIKENLESSQINLETKKIIYSKNNINNEKNI